MLKPLSLLLCIAVALPACMIEETSTTTLALGSSSISADATTYVSGAPITVSWADAPGNAHDWVALSVAGGAEHLVLRWVYLQGAVDGSTTFAGLTVGDYEARLFSDDSYQIVASTSFAVTGTALTTDRPAYASGPVVVSWSGLPGTSTDWVALAPAGSPAVTVTSWIYTGGATSGSHAFSLPAAGTYVARAFPQDSYTIAGESAPFEAGTTISTAGFYAAGTPITVTWEHATANARDWVSLAPAGSPATTVQSWIYTAGASSGSHTFPGLATGTYLARFYTDDSYSILVESASITVGDEPPPPPPTGTITVAQAAYGWGQDITVTWSGFPTNNHDWITIAPAGSPDITTTRWFYTNGQSAGTHTFTGGLPASALGTYVARGFVDDSLVRVAQSSAFVIQDACVELVPSNAFFVTESNAPQLQNMRTMSAAEVMITSLTNNAEITLPCVETVTGNLRIIDHYVSNTTLRAVRFPRLHTVSGTLTLGGAVGQFEAPRLSNVQGVIVNGTAMVDLSVFSGITGTLSELRVSSAAINNADVPGVSSLHGLEGITAVTGDVIITSIALTDLQGLEGVATIGGDLTAYQLESLRGLDGLTSVGGAVLFAARHYDAGLDSLVSIGGDLRLDTISFPFSPDPDGYLVTGFTHLETIGGALHLDFPHRVIFPVLRSAHDFFAYGGFASAWIEFRAPMLTQVVDQFVLINQWMLPACQVYAVYDQLTQPGPGPMRVQLGNYSDSCPM